MIAWMLYSVLVATMLATAAGAAQSLARILGYRLRWIWVGALGLTTILSAGSALNRLGPPEQIGALAASSQSASIRSTNSSWLEIGSAFVGDARRTVTGAIAAVERLIDHGVSSTATIYVLCTWLSVSIGLAIIFVVVLARVHRARRQWPLSRVQQVRVRISPAFGPVVVGLVRPEIIVPRWLLHRSADEQQLAITHEQEHLRTHDPLVLGLAWIVAIAAPWNPAVWYMVSRLRLAIELDCDARVLRRGVSARAYGSLLIEVAQNASPLTLSALGFAEESSQLYQRILALRGSTATFPRARGIAAACFAMMGVFVACTVAPPTQSVATDTQTVAVRRIGSADRAAGGVGPFIVRNPRRTSAAGGPSSIARHVDSVLVKTQPLFIVDGVRVRTNGIDGIDPKTIANVEVIKGAAAIAEYGPDAERGVVIVKTRNAAAPQ
jgi:bla regulator protein BlaR1